MKAKRKPDYGPRERNQHQDIVTVHVKEGGKDFLRAYNKTEDPLNRLTWLSEEQREAARRFRSDFEAAGMGENFAVMNTERIDNGYSDIPDRYLVAVDATRKRLNLLDGMAKSIIINVVGMGKPFSEWVSMIRTDPAIVALDEKIARGILWGALDVLVKYEGLA